MTDPTTLEINLTDLIARCDAELADRDDLARISQARRRAQALAHLGDQLIDHYVTAAKRGGASWDQISDALGTTGACTAHRAPNPFERFTQANRHAIVLAQEGARAHRHNRIGTEHLLLGLFSEPESTARELLLEVSSALQVRAAIDAALAPSEDEALSGHIAFAQDCEDVIGQALRTAADLGHGWVGTEHMLLALTGVRESAAAQILHELGFTVEKLRAMLANRVTPSEK